MTAISRTGPSELLPATADALDAVARRAGPAIANAQRYSEAREQAELDSLTGLLNHRLFYEFLGREIARARRYERFVSLVVFDLDDFKRINDRARPPRVETPCSPAWLNASAPPCARPTSPAGSAATSSR